MAEQGKIDMTATGPTGSERESQRIADAIAEGDVERPARKKPLNKAALQHARAVLQAVRRRVADERNGHEITDDERAKIIEDAGKDVTARMAETLRDAAKFILDTHGQFVGVDGMQGAISVAAFKAADEAPANFGQAAEDTREPADIVASIPRS
jgi:hypothetical protein